MTDDPNARLTLRWAGFAFAVSVSLTVLKFIAWHITGSTAVLSDALESIINIVTSGFGFYSVWLSNKPRDADHPYGHGKIEYFSAGLEGALILFAAIAIVIVSLPSLWAPRELDALGAGAILMSVVTALTLAGGTAVMMAGKRLGSPTLHADGEHLRSDAITSVAVLVGVLAVMLTGIRILDTLCALGVAGWLAYTGLGILRRAFAGLMDEADPQVLGEVAHVLESMRAPGWIAPHHVKIHHLGRHRHVDMHMVFPRWWSLERTHEATVQMERVFREKFGSRTELMVHMEGCTPVSCSYCDVDECPVRQALFVRRLTWTAEQIQTAARPQPIEPVPPDA
jgi:cation diffusion facilitator family transporter